MQIKWDIEHVYLYLISFIALILIIIGAVNITQTAIAYFTPVYEEYNPLVPRGISPDLALWEEEFGPELMERERIRYDTISRENYNRRLIRDLINGISFVVIALPVYLYHWRKIPKLDNNE